MAEKIDWQALISLGLHQLRLEPDVFWNLTPFELMITATGVQTSTVFDRKTFSDLAALYPDE